MGGPSNWAQAVRLGGKQASSPAKPLYQLGKQPENGYLQEQKISESNKNDFTQMTAYGAYRKQISGRKEDKCFCLVGFWVFSLSSLTMGACFPEQLLSQKHGSSSESSNCISEATPREMPSA